MKTLKTLLAVTLLVSSVASSFAMQDGEEQTSTLFVMRDGEEQAGKWLKNTMAANYLKFFEDDEERNFSLENLARNKARVAATVGLYAAIAAAVTGAGYALYSFLTSEDEEEVTEAPVAQTEPAVKTVPAPVVEEAPVVAPVVKQPRGGVRNDGPRGGFGKRAKPARAHKARARKASCKSCR